MYWGTPMFGNVTALEGLHVIREMQETKARWRHATGMRHGILTGYEPWHYPAYEVTQQNSAAVEAGSGRHGDSGGRGAP